MAGDQIRWAGTGTTDGEPDIVLAAAGDVPTLEVLAAARLLRDYVPYLRVRVVDVVDLMGLLPPGDHPHGFGERKFERLFTAAADVVFAFHGYPRAVHQLLHGRPGPAGSTSAATPSRAPPPRRSTWSCSTG